jgi:glycosyltransferase involved in cell wall biosynthesis
MAMKARPYLSIIIPAYNEAMRIRRSLSRLVEHLGTAEELRGPAEVLVVDDGSNDGTAATVEDFIAGLPSDGPRFRLLRNGLNRGKGYSIKHGVLSAAGEYLLLSDTDFSTPIEELPRLLGLVRDGGYEIAIGSRGLADSKVEVHQPMWRESMGRCFNKVVRAISGLRFRDTQCGFKVMRREAVLSLFRAARVERFAYDVELLYLARKAGVPAIEVPVIWRNAPGSKVNALLDSFDMLMDVIRVVLRDRRGGYGGLGRQAAGARRRDAAGNER